MHSSNSQSPHRSNSLFSPLFGREKLSAPKGPVHDGSLLTPAIHIAVNEAAELYNSTRWDGLLSPSEVSIFSFTLSSFFTKHWLNTDLVKPFLTPFTPSTGTPICGGYWCKERPLIEAVGHCNWHRSISGITHSKSQPICYRQSNPVQHLPRSWLHSPGMRQPEGQVAIWWPRMVPLGKASFRLSIHGRQSPPRLLLAGNYDAYWYIQRRSGRRIAVFEGSYCSDRESTSKPTITQVKFHRVSIAFDQYLIVC